MTNTKFRKRALLSSVAMLLVALVALGSATFAWFTANPTVTAQTLKMQATAGAGIQIASDYALSGKDTSEAKLAAYGYSTELSDGSAFSLDPASPNTGATVTANTLPFGFVDGTAPDDGDAKGTFAPTTPYTLGGTGRVFYEDIWLKSTSGDTVTVASAKVSITSTTHTGKEIERGVKIALVKDNAIIGIWKAADGENSKVWNGGTTANTPASDLVAYSSYTANQGVVTGLDMDVAGKIKGEDGAVKVRMYVYLDGEQTEVVSNNALTATELFSAIDVKFSTATLT